MVIPNQTSTIRVQDVQVTNVVEEGAGCPENGRQARNANGAPLFCQSGIWKPAQSYLDSTMQAQDIQVTNVVEEGTKCPENGRQARNANGTPLFCQSGVWRLAVSLPQHQIPQYQIVSDYACGVDNLIISCPAGWQVISGGGNVWAPQCGAQPTGGTSDGRGFWMSVGLDVSQPTSDMTGWWIGGMHDKSLGDNLQGFAICMKQ